MLCSITMHLIWEYLFNNQTARSILLYFLVTTIKFNSYLYSLYSSVCSTNPLLFHQITLNVDRVKMSVPGHVSFGHVFGKLQFI